MRKAGRKNQVTTTKHHYEFCILWFFLQVTLAVLLLGMVLEIDTDTVEQ